MTGQTGQTCGPLLALNRGRRRDDDSDERRGARLCRLVPQEPAPGAILGTEGES